MKKVYFFSAIICILLLAVFAFTFKKTERSKGNGAHSNIVNQGNEWFQSDFTVVHILSGGEIQYNKALTEQWYTDFLRANEKNRHDVAYAWQRIAGERVVYRLTAYITPAAGLTKSISNGVTVNKPDPPTPPAPPPPEMTW